MFVYYFAHTNMHIHDINSVDAQFCPGYLFLLNFCNVLIVVLLYFCIVVVFKCHMCRVVLNCVFIIMLCFVLN